MCLASLSIVSVEGKILASRDYRGEVRSFSNVYTSNMIKKTTPQPPCMCLSGVNHRRGESRFE